MRDIQELKELGIEAGCRLLLVFAHPDDEAVFAGGLAQQALKAGAVVRLLTLTGGEKSSRRYQLAPGQDLAEARAAELRQGCAFLGLQDLHVAHFPDGGLSARQDEAQAYVENEIKAFAARVVATFEPGGVSGHADHRATSKILTDLCRRGACRFQLIYAAGYRSRALAHIEAKAMICLQLSREEAARKLQALEAHRTQFHPDKVRQWFKSEEMQREYFYLAAENLL